MDSVPLLASATVAAHARISVNNLSSLYQSMADDIAMWQRLGVDHVGLISPKLAAEGWGAAEVMVRQAGLRVSNVAAEYPVLAESLRFAAAVGAGTVYVCSGPGGARPWEDSAAAFCEGIAPLASLAEGLGVRLGVEPTNPLRGDVSFVFSLRDALDLARAAGIGVVLDFYSCWYERGFEELVHKNIDSVALVQVNDFVLGTLDTPNRAVPGDGDVPLKRLLSAVVEAGYEGAFDLEILGPRIEAEGYEAAIRRSVVHVGDLLVELGVPG
jgi:sugar phosphate isomerase/epimerase